MPEEPLEAAVKTLVQAALGRPARDRATTLRGAVGYMLVRAHTRPRDGRRDASLHASGWRGAAGSTARAIARDFMRRLREQ